MEIKPTYVTFEQAKLLKEKGFDLKCNALFIHEIRQGDTDWKILELFGRTNDTYEFLLSCDMDWQKNYLRPEQWQVVEWLRVKYGIWVTVFTNKAKDWKTLWSFRLDWIYPEDTLDLEDVEPKYYKIPSYVTNEFDSPQEAYEAAFDYILKELI